MYKFNRKLVNKTGIVIGIIAMAALLLSGCGGGTNAEPAPFTTSSATSSSTVPLSKSTSILTTSSSTSSSVSTSNKPASQGSIGSASITFDKDSVKPGESFTVNVMFTTSIQSGGASIALAFDPSAMQCDGVTEGTFYKNWATKEGIETLVIPEAIIDNVKGTVSEMGIACMGQTRAEKIEGIISGASGTGLLCSYKMTARSGVNKLAEVSITILKVSDAGGKKTLDKNGFAINNGAVKIGTP